MIGKFVFPLLITILALLALMACGGPTLTLNRDAAQVDAAAGKMADFDLPDGYHTDFAANMMGYSVAAYSNGEGHSHLYLIQSDNDADGGALESRIGQLHLSAGDQQARMDIVETYPVHVRGEESTAVISEGVNSEGTTYRQAMIAFQGKSGPAMLVYSEPLHRWNQERVDALIASLE